MRVGGCLVRRVCALVCAVTPHSIVVCACVRRDSRHRRHTPRIDSVSTAYVFSDTGKDITARGCCAAMSPSACHNHPFPSSINITTQWHGKKNPPPHNPPPPTPFCLFSIDFSLVITLRWTWGTRTAQGRFGTPPLHLHLQAAFLDDTTETFYFPPTHTHNSPNRSVLTLLRLSSSPTNQTSINFYHHRRNLLPHPLSTLSRFSLVLAPNTRTRTQHTRTTHAHAHSTHATNRGTSKRG